MAITGVVSIAPMNNDMREVVLGCEDFGLGKPLDECGNKKLGRLGEELASLYLESMGMEVLERNWSCSFGEVDIIGEQDGRLVMVEVKLRVVGQGDSDVAPELAVDYRKQNRYRKLALMYLSRQTRFDSIRFDVVGVRLMNEREAQLRHYVGAYEWDD